MPNNSPTGLTARQTGQLRRKADRTGRAEDDIVEAMGAVRIRMGWSMTAIGAG